MPGVSLRDLMSLDEFQDELRRVARFDPKEPLANPLATAVQKIRDNPAFAQSRLLARLLQALVFQAGEFRRAEASAFDAETLRIVIALLNAARAGSTAHEEWQRAVSECSDT